MREYCCDRSTEQVLIKNTLNPGPESACLKLRIVMENHHENAGPSLSLTATRDRSRREQRKSPSEPSRERVIDVQSLPVAGASVTIQTSDGQHPHATHTDAAGHFQFARFETGQYDLRAYFKGAYSDWDKRVPLRSHKSTEITLRITLTS